MFEGVNLMQQGSDNPTALLLNLLEKENIELKTDLSLQQIKTVVKLRWYLLVLNNREKNPYELFLELLDYFMVLMCSNDRKSRKEIISGLQQQGPSTDVETKNLISKIK